MTGCEKGVRPGASSLVRALHCERREWGCGRLEKRVPGKGGRRGEVKKLEGG